jgi:molybdopterin-dependent oxidoreductase alpha subunit
MSKEFEIDDSGEVRSENPEQRQALQQTQAKKSAAGWPALESTARNMLGEMGPARAAKVLFSLNQMQGSDCPGCAWPDPDDKRSVLGEYCENGAKAVAEEATLKKVDAQFLAEHSLVELSQLDDYRLGKLGRLTEPMYKAAGASHYIPISWDDALDKVAGHLKTLEKPDDAIFYTSGRTSNEAAYLYQLLVRSYGTNNLPDCSNMCHESSGQALSHTLGIGKGSVTLDDFSKAQLILVAGQNPGTNHPRMLSALEKAKKAGARIVSINPLQEAGLVRFKNPQRVSGLLGNGTALADQHLQLRIGSDLALAKALLKMLLAAGEAAIDLDFIRSKCEGFELLQDDLNNYELSDLIDQTGLPEDQVETTAKWIAESERIICCWAMGLTQHRNAVEGIQEYINLLLLKGSIGKPGAGTCPVRGHSNVQGDRTMGIWEKPKEAFLDQLDARYGIKSPREHGHDTVHAIAAMHPDKSASPKVFFAMGGNFLSATPDTIYTAEALQNCTLTVQVSTKINRSHLICGKEAIILPCLGRTEIDKQQSKEQFVTCENSMGVVHQSRGVLKPVSKALKSEVAIVCELAQKLLPYNPKMRWDLWKDNYDLIRDEIEAVIPGFDEYNKRVREKGGFYLPNGPRKGEFHGPNGRAKITLNPLPDPEQAEGSFDLMTIRSHDQFNTTIYGRDDRYRGLYGDRRVVLINPSDIREQGWEARQAVDIISAYPDSDGQIEERVARNFLLVPYDIPRGCLASYFPETNVLVPLHHQARGSHTPVSKKIRVQLRPS